MFISQITVLMLMALLMGRIHVLSTSRGMQLVKALEEIPGQLENVLV